MLTPHPRNKPHRVGSPPASSTLRCNKLLYRIRTRQRRVAALPAGWRLWITNLGQNKRLFESRQFRKDGGAGCLEWMNVAAIAQDDEAQLLRRDQPNISLRIIEPARLVDDGGAARIDDFPGHSLDIVCAHPEHTLLGRFERPPHLAVDRPVVNARGGQDREVAWRREHLAGAGEVELVLLIAGKADRLPAVGIALDRALHELSGHDGAVVRAALRHQSRIHAERLGDAISDQLGNRTAIATLKHKLQQYVSRVRVDLLLTWLFAVLRRVVVEQIDELRQWIAFRRQRFRLGGHYQPRGVCRELADSDPSYVIAVQLADILGHAIVEGQFAALHAERDQNGLENLADRPNVEQRVR